MDQDHELREVRNRQRVAAVRGAYFQGLRGRELRQGASAEEQRAFRSGRERRSLGRERIRG